MADGLAARADRLLGRALLDGEDPQALGLVRILVVSILLASALCHVGAVAEYFSADSVLAGRFAEHAFPRRFSLFFWIEDPWAVRTIFAIGIVAHVMWLFGLYTVPAALASWLLWVSMVGRQPLLYSLPDQLQMSLCTLLALMPSGRGLSLDARWRGKGGPVPVWCRRIIQLQMAVVYTSTGLLKDGATWRGEGTALYYSIANPYNRHFDVPELFAALQPWVLRPSTWLVLVWEIGFVGFVALHWLRELLGRPRRVPDLRKAYLGFGVLMHAGIQVLMYVAWFSPLSIASYAAFLDPDEVKRALARRGRRRGAPG